MIEEQRDKYLLLNNTYIEDEWLDESVHIAIKKHCAMIDDEKRWFGWHALRPMDASGLMDPTERFTASAGCR